MISSVFLVLCGLGGTGLLYWLWRRSGAWYHWVLALGLYLWICFGISFVYINSIGYHHQAAAFGSAFFGIIAVAWAFVTARTMGLIGKKKEA